MTDTPPDWVLIEAAKRSNFAYSLGFIRNNYGTMSQCYRALCDMIAKYEQPPVDRKLLCARRAYEEWCKGEQGTHLDTAIRAIELWDGGYGQ